MIRSKITYRNAVTRASVPPEERLAVTLRKEHSLIFLIYPLLYQSHQHNIMCDTCLIFVVALKHTFLFVLLQR